MAQFSTSTVIDAPPQEVFDLFADIVNADQYIRSIQRIELLSDGPVGVGTRFRETRVFFNREATETMEFTAFEPPSHYRVECSSHGAHYVSDFHFSAEGPGTRVTVDFRVEPNSLFARIMSVFSSLMMGPLRKCTEQDLADLKDVAEAGG